MAKLFASGNTASNWQNRDSNPEVQLWDLCSKQIHYLASQFVDEETKKKNASNVSG